MARRWLVIVAWFLAFFFGWALVCNGVFYAIMYFGNDRGVNLPSWIDPVYNIGFVAVGIVVVPISGFILAIVGFLPGTRPATADRRRGFPVETIPPKDIP